MRYIIILFFLLMASLNSHAFTNMDAAFYFGPPLNQTGGIQKLGKPSFNTAFEFNYFFNPNHGLGLSTGYEFAYGGENQLSYISQGSIQTIEFHYAFKHRLKNSKYQIAFSPGFGWQTLYDKSGDTPYYQDLSSSWVLDYKLMFDYFVYEWNKSNNDMSFFVGGGLSQIFSYNDSLQGQDISGNRLSLLFRLAVGF